MKILQAGSGAFNIFVPTANSTYKRDIFRESLQMLFLLALSVFVVYKLPKVFGFIFIITVVFIFWGSKKDYFWIAYFFIIICCPGSFFSEAATYDAPYLLPQFSIIRGITFSTHEVLMIATLLKAIVFGKKYRYILEKSLKLILFYAGFLLVLSILVYGSSFSSLIHFLRNFLFYSYFISFPFLIRKNEEIVKFIWMLFPIVFFIFFTAVFFFITGNQFLYFFNPDSKREIIMFGMEQRFGLYGGGHMFLLLCFIFSLLLSILNNNRNVYLNIVGILSYLSILMTATRVWFVVFTLILITFLFKSIKSKKMMKGFIFLLVIFAIIFTISSYNPTSGSKVKATSERLFSIFDLGEEEAQSTRLIEGKMKDRLPKVLEGISENPIFGWGFSDKATTSLDADVGNFSLIAQVGVLGFLLFVYFWSSYFKLIAKAKKILSTIRPFKNAFSILSMSFLGFLIAHFTTHQFFGLTRHAYDIFFISLFIFLSEFFVREALYTKKQLLNSMQNNENGISTRTVLPTVEINPGNHIS